MRNADMHPTHSQSLANVPCAAAERDGGPAMLVVAGFNIDPLDASCPTCAHRLENGFLSTNPEVLLLIEAHATDDDTACWKVAFGSLAGARCVVRLDGKEF